MKHVEGQILEEKKRGGEGPAPLPPQGRPFEKIQEGMFCGKAPWLCRDLPKHLVNIKETTFLLSNTAERE